MTGSLSDSRLANIGAKTIYHAFDTYQLRFQEITRRAQARFEARDWTGQQVDALERLDVYKAVLTPLVAKIRSLLGDRYEEKLIWVSMKAVYSNLIEERPDCEIAETFFNSATRRIFDTVGVDPQIEFVTTDFDLFGSGKQMVVYRTFVPPEDRLASAVMEILEDYGFQVPFVHLTKDAQRIAERIGEAPGRIEMVHKVFFRGMGAYLIGRLVYADMHIRPLAISLMNTEKGLVVDAVLLDENSCSILFSFARSYFHVIVNRPYDLVAFLRTIMPRKRIAELYISIGYNKHGKTELYRNFLNHLSRTDTCFEISPGQRGMVMIVFNMPDHDLVFKIIKDRFAQPKKSTRQDVLEKYDWVFKRDRAGRLIDAQEFEHLKIERSYFDQDLLEELLQAAGDSVQIEGEYVVIAHAYLERRVTPLDLYLKEADFAAAAAAVVEYGDAIKDMASTNVFPGDMLLKNFGVTRHGRVVFYDYDELCPLTDCNFRKIPQAYYYEDELASEPWFPVGANDVFPEEFRHFITLPAELMDVFNKHHGDLLDVEFWQKTQERIKNGEALHIFPYMPEQRLAHHANELE